MNNKELIMFENFLKELDTIKTMKELKNLKVQFKMYFKNFNTYYKGVELLERKEVKIKTLNVKNDYLKYNLTGLYNLLYDNNKLYNANYTKDNIINDILNFKSLNFLKFKTLNLEEKRTLKKKYSFLMVKKDCIPEYTKVYRIKKAFYILKTVRTDNIKITIFYYKKSDLNSLFNKYNKKLNFNKSVGNQSNFNFSSLNAFKELEKEDNIRFYGYCNRMGLDKSNRDLLRSIKKMEGGKTFSTYLEDLEASINELKEFIRVNPYDIDLNKELDKREKELWTLTEEHNSDVRKTTIEDYY